MTNIVFKRPMKVTVNQSIIEYRVRPVTYLGQCVVVVVDLAGGVRIREVSRRKVVQGEVDALSWLGDQLDGARRNAVGQRTQAARRRGGRRVAVSEDRHTAAGAAADGRPVAAALRDDATDVAELSRYRLLAGVQTLVVVRQYRCTVYNSTCCELFVRLRRQQQAARGIVWPGRPSVRPHAVRSLTPISRDAMSSYLVDGF